jgi:hypothetical protein
MSAGRRIPVTDILRLYRRLRTAPQRKRLDQAEKFVADPGQLAKCFADSVTKFGPYDNVDHPFYPKRPKHQPVTSKLQRTNDLVLRLEDVKELEPVPAEGSMAEPPSGVRPVEADKLAFGYVDRELLVQRTESPAKWSDGRKNGGGTRLDIVLVDVAGPVRVPIVAELKLPGDMDPFFALVQALTCTAHLATRNQYQRMRKHLKRGEFPDLPSEPRLDVFVLMVVPPGQKKSAPKGKYMPGLHRAAAELAPKLLAEPGIARSVRRIAELGVWLEGPKGRKKVRANVRWAWESAAPS